MNLFSGIIGRDKEFSDFLGVMRTELASERAHPAVVNGLSGGAEMMFLAEAVTEARRLGGKPALVLCSDEAVRDSVCQRLSSFGLDALTYKERDFVFYNIGASHDTERERLSVLSALVSRSCDCVVTTPRAAAILTAPPETLLNSRIFASLGDEIALGDLVGKLETLGFARVDAVDNAGQYSVRGGIVDVFGTEAALPVRIEFFGDEVDRISAFDPITQRSKENLSSFELLPARELLVNESARAAIKKALADLIKKAPSDTSLTRLKSELASLEAGGVLNFADKFISAVYESEVSLLDYFSDTGHAVFVLGTNECRANLEKFEEALRGTVKGLIENGLTKASLCSPAVDKEKFEGFLDSSFTVHVNSFAGGVKNKRLSGLFGFRCRRTVAYGSNPRMLVEDVLTYKKSGYSVLVLSESEQGARSVSDTLCDAGIPNAVLKDGALFSAMDTGVYVGVGSCEGFDLIMPKLAVLSTAQDEGKRIMANRRRRRILKEAGGAGERLISYADLSPGDYVVHLNYGIGMFEGIETVTVDGVTKDYITIKYAGTDKLFVPCDKLDMIGKYIGSRDSSGGVKLSKMGGGDWVKTKTRAKSAAKDMAKELINLYAQRQRMPGFAFPPDSELEDSFAADFGFEETDSQLSAIDDIKRDMMRPVPMNRLLLGDVGFGKTEVALRAAFKAIMGGKQVAILVPTTVLALQHFETASSRMRNYPVTVEILTRFRTLKEQANILRRVKRGEIDVLIGTHKLLSKSLEFRDLGLLIIDEEQRFGVAQKEKLKAAAKNVDILTLSATPIPRTLNMAMNAISDMSLLDEAPGERKPVQTYVLEHDEAVIYDAIERELARSGQVFYLHNEVSTIGFTADKIATAFPMARVAVAHGQMDKDEIEDIWRALVDAEVDILVCTTIIETGIDLPSANTLIIENADRFGLSQLHQIRGRVGRSARQAYAYFTYRVGKAISEEAAKRLSAIREFAEFGAGFKVALRDLEIRGAGNLLGAEQHGYIDSVGYDLYVKLLSEAVLEESGEVREEKPETLIDIKVSAHIPESYIRESSHRMEMYKKISLIKSAEDKDDVSDELCDRFGDVPLSVERLLNVALIKSIATEAGLSRIDYSGNVLSFFTKSPNLAAWGAVMEAHRGMSVRAASGMACVSLRVTDAPSVTRICENIMKEYALALLTDEDKNG
ncbi:MAG: transcription-repair coupling factor [Clostridia bacterium]|nr:transcription-repair coupling factor [Clostridia bacterium]